MTAAIVLAACVVFVAEFCEASSGPIEPPASIGMVALNSKDDCENGYQRISEFDFKERSEPMKQGIRRAILLCICCASLWSGMRLLGSQWSLWRHRAGLFLCATGPLGLLLGWNWL